MVPALQQSSIERVRGSSFYPFGSLYPDFVAAVEEEFNKSCDIFRAEFAGMLTLGSLVAGRIPVLFMPKCQNSNHRVSSVFRSYARPL